VALQQLESAIHEGLERGDFKELESVDEVIAQAEAEMKGK
jgi:hypothetical protein